ncbi:MAG: agmatine deiminase family protein [Pseudomonadota bacterium]
MSKTTPYLLPAEWAPQCAVMLTWPHGHGDWQPYLARVEPVFVEIARHICRFEKLLITCFDDEHQRHIQQRLNQADVDPSRVRFHIVESDDTWVRDHGPITVYQNGRPVLLDFIFNGWGNKFDAQLDNEISGKLHTQGAFGKTPMEHIDLILEGGGIEVDGQGTLLATSRCLLAPTRNPQLSKAQTEAKLAELFGLKRVLWLDNGYLAGDDTDSHIDTLARFCDANTITYVACDDPADEHYPELKAMEEELKAFRTLDGKPYRLVPLPWPEAKHNERGKRLPASYANFLIINGAVLVPTYEDPADAIALERLKGCFPGREIVDVPCLPLILQYGSLHCVTMQLPRGVI